MVCCLSFSQYDLNVIVMYCIVQSLEDQHRCTRGIAVAAVYC